MSGEKGLGFARGTLSRDAAWSLAYSCVLRCATLGVSIAVGRIAGSTATGAFGIALQVAGLGAVLAAFNLPQSLTKHLAEHESLTRRRALLRTSGILVLGIALIVGAGLSALAGRLASVIYRAPTLTTVIFWCGPLAMAAACTAWAEGAFQGLRRFEWLMRWGAAVSGLDLVFGILCSIWGVVGVVLCRTVIRGFAALAALAALTRWLRPGTPVPSSEVGNGAGPGVGFAETAGPLLGFAGPVLLSTAIVLVAQSMQRVLLVRNAGLGTAGHYQAADSLAQGLTLIPAAAGVAFMRAVSSGHGNGYPGFQDSLRRAIERVCGYNLGLCLALIGVVPWLAVVLWGLCGAAVEGDTLADET